MGGNTEININLFGRFISIKAIDVKETDIITRNEQVENFQPSELSQEAKNGLKKQLGVWFTRTKMIKGKHK